MRKLRDGLVHGKRNSRVKGRNVQDDDVGHEQEVSEVEEARGIQTIFAPDGSLISSGQSSADRIRHALSLKAFDKMGKKRAVCPYCTYIGTMDKFAILGKTYMLSARFTCPSCNQTMLKRTLSVFDRGPEEYSKWFWESFSIDKKMHRNRFRFEAIKKTIRELGFGDVFWGEWKKRKEKQKSH